jgi:hypothetical protein
MRALYDAVIEELADLPALLGLPNIPVDQV